MSTSIRQLLDSMHTLLSSQEAAVDQLSAAAREAREGNERWRIERQVLAGQILTAKCPNLVHSLPLFDAEQKLHPDVMAQLQTLSSSMTLTVVNELVAKTMQRVKDQKGVVEKLSALPKLDEVQTKANQILQRLTQEKAQLAALEKNTNGSQTALVQLTAMFDDTPWLKRFSRAVKDHCELSNPAASESKAVQKAEEAIQELANWTAPKPWYLRLVGVGSEGRAIAKRVQSLEHQTNRPIAVLIQEAGRAMALKQLQELRTGEVSQLAYQAQQDVQDIEEALKKLLPNRTKGQPWREALPTDDEWRQAFYKEVFAKLLTQEPLSQVASRLGLSELVDPLEQAEAKRDVMSRIVEATEDVLRARRNEVSQTSEQVKKIDKAARKRPSQTVSIDLSKIQAASPQIKKAASAWRAEVSRLNKSVSNVPRSRDSAPPAVSSSYAASSSSASSSSGGMGFWEFYLWSSLLSGPSYAHAEPASPLTSQVLNLDSSDVKSFGDIGVDTSSLGNSLSSGFDANSLDLSGVTASTTLSSDSWSSIDNALSSVSESISSTSFSSCSSGPSNSCSSSSSSSCSSSSCSSSSSSSSCGGGGSD
jgi:hypothetical protein